MYHRDRSDRWKARWIHLSVVLSLIWFGSVTIAVPMDCSSPDLPTLTMENKYAIFEIKGAKITASAKNTKTGGLITAGKVIYHLDSIIEAPVARNATHDICPSLRTLYIEPVDLNRTFYNTYWTRNMTSSDALCEISNEWISIAPGKFAEAIILNTSWPQDPGASVRYTFGITNSSEPVVVRSYPASSSTQFFDLSYSFIPFQLKMIMEIDNWVWKDPRASFISLLVHIEHFLYLNDENSISSLSWELDPMMLAVTTQLPVNDGKLTVTVVNDLSAVVDDVPYVFGVVDPSNTPGTLGANPVIFDTIRRLSVVVPFCNPVVNFVGQQFQHLWYDPSLSFLFSSNTQQNANPEQKKQNKTAIIAGSVSGAVVVILVAAVVIVYVKSPRFRLLVRPSLKRHLAAKDSVLIQDSGGASHSNSSSNQGWAKSQRPADI